MRSSTLIIVPVVCASVLLLARAAEASCDALTSDANAMSAMAKGVQHNEATSHDNAARASWNSMNHYALHGAHEFNACSDTEPRLLYAVTFADATAVGMHYGMLPWSEGTGDIGSALQIIDALPHSSAVAKEWKLVDQLYVQACSMHNATCARRTY
jgi:hypothetical protein